MELKELVKDKARALFNERGVMNTTLRDVADALNENYEDITYHYPTQKHVIQELYEDMVGGLQLVSMDILDSGGDLLAVMLNAPKFTFDLSLRYLFLFKDFVEIKRTYSEIAQAIEASNEKRKKTMIQSLLILQFQNKIRLDLEPQELDYLVELSGVMRTYFLMKQQPSDFEKPELQKEYILYVNQLLMPYLTEEGIKQYDAFMNAL